MKNLQMIGLALGIAMMAWGGITQQTQNFGVQHEKLDSALDKLMGVVGEQIDTADRELKAFLQKAEGDVIESAINIGIDEITNRLEATPEQVAEIRPIFRKDVETTGEILDEALSVGLAAARVSLTRSLDRQWKDVRADLSKTLSEEQLKKADKMQAELATQLVGLFEPPEQKKEK